MNHIGKTVRATFDKYCYTTFSSKEHADKVKHFFKNFLDYEISYSSKDKIDLVNNILDERGEKVLIATIDYFIENYKWKKFTDKSKNHFINLVRKFELPKEEIIQSTEFTDNDIKVSFPVRVEHARPGEYPKFPRFEYNHKCSQCNSIYNPWQQNCPNCNALIDWTKEV